jgi:hypothetical protein
MHNAWFLARTHDYGCAPVGAIKYCNLKNTTPKSLTTNSCQNNKGMPAMQRRALRYKRHHRQRVSAYEDQHKMAESLNRRKSIFLSRGLLWLLPHAVERRLLQQPNTGCATRLMSSTK